MTKCKWNKCWKKSVQVAFREVRKKEEIETREGKLYAYPETDVIIRGVQGEIYPCKKDIFAQTYATTAPIDLVSTNIQEVCRVESYAEELQKRRLDEHKSGRTFESGFQSGWQAAWHVMRKKLNSNTSNKGSD